MSPGYLQPGNISALPETSAEEVRIQHEARAQALAAERSVREHAPIEAAPTTASTESTGGPDGRPLLARIRRWFHR